MEYTCPACSNVFLIETEHFGQMVECPHCHKTISIPASVGTPASPVAGAVGASAAPTAGAAGAEATKQCPYCGERVLKVARRCKFCKSDIPEGFDSDSAASRLQAKEPLIAQQAAGAPSKLPYSVRGRFQWSTIVVAGSTLICAIAAIIGFSVNEREPLFILGPMGIIIGFILLLATLATGIRDLLGVKYFGRLTPEKGAKAFFGGLCAKRYLFAYYCLLDADKDQTLRMRPALAKLGTQAEQCSFDRYEGFRDYWKKLLHKGGMQASFKKIQLVRSEGDFAEVSATLKLTQQSTTGFLAFGVIGSLLMANRETLPIKKLFRRVNGQWYAVNGELDSGEDRFGFDGQAGNAIDAEVAEG